MRTGSLGSVPSLRLAFTGGCEVESPFVTAAWAFFLGADLLLVLGAIESLYSIKARYQRPINNFNKVFKSGNVSTALQISYRSLNNVFVL